MMIANEHGADLTPSPEGVHEPTVDVRGVNYSFGQGESRKQVLFDNNLTLFPGEITIMTGPSGSGKTTFLTLIGALRNPQEGSLKVFGRELKGLGPAEQEKVRSNIGFIFQTHNLLDSLTAFQNVKLATELRRYGKGEADRRTNDILTRMGLAERMNYKPGNLSVGQNQRVAICRALVNQPGMILADEPTAALDKDTGGEVVDLLYSFAKKNGCTIMIVTHDNRILDVADRIVTMVDGCVTSDVNYNESLSMIRFLRTCPVFENSTPAILGSMAGRLRREFHPAGAVIIRHGLNGDKFYIIRSGKIEICKEVNGKEEFLHRLEQGGIFGESVQFRQLARATEDVELLVLEKDAFMETAGKSAMFDEQFRKSHIVH